MVLSQILVAMASSTSLTFLYPILLLTTIIIAQTQVFAQPPFLHHSCLNDKGNYTASSSYHTNLNHLLSSLLSTDGNGYGFYSSSYPGNSSGGQVYAIGLCRGDVSADACRSCLNDSTHALTEVCPNQKEAIGWYEKCMLRYSNRSIYGGVMETKPAFHLWVPQNGSSSSKLDPDHHDGLFRELRKLLESLKSEAAAGGPLRKFAVGNANGTISAVAQCTPDLSELQCKECLSGAFGDLPKCCDGEEGGRVVRPSCNFMYQVDRFVDPTVVETPIPSPGPPANIPPSRAPKSNKRRVIIVVLPLVLIISIGIYMRVERRRNKLKSIEEFVRFDFDIIIDATNNFSETNKLSRADGYSAVYKGKLFDNKDIAVKRIPMNLGPTHEFIELVRSIAKIDHPNLVKLLGFSLKGNEKLLIYEFISNAKLGHIIFDPIKRTHLDWNMRYKIIVGIARGLLYLHEEFYNKTCHGYLNVNSILIDAEINPKISDFGMDRYFVINNASQVANSVYMAPECIMEADFSFMSDVYSFGVLVLEIVTGQESNFNLEEQNPEDLLSYAWKNWGEGILTNRIDPTLWSRSGSELMMRCIQIGLLCVQKNKADRPTMASVVLMLNSSSIHHPVPIIRPFATSTEIAPRRRYKAKAQQMWHRCKTFVRSCTSLHSKKTMPCAPVEIGLGDVEINEVKL